MEPDQLAPEHQTCNQRDLQVFAKPCGLQCTAHSGQDLSWTMHPKAHALQEKSGKPVVIFC